MKIACFILLIVSIVMIVHALYIKMVLKIRTNTAIELLDDQELLFSYFSRDDLGTKLKQWFALNEKKTVAIAFERRAGRLVLKKLKEEEINVVYCISTNAQGEIEQLDVYHPLCDLEQVDLIIVLSDIEKTIEMLRQRNDAIKIMSIKELLKEIR